MLDSTLVLLDQAAALPIIVRIQCLPRAHHRGAWGWGGGEGASRSSSTFSCPAGSFDQARLVGQGFNMRSRVPPGHTICLSRVMEIPRQELGHVV